LFRKIGPTYKILSKEDLEVKSSDFAEVTNRSIPSVSIITSTYHAERYLKNFLTSISNLNGIEDYELIVIDANEDDADFNLIIRHAPQNIRLKIIRTKKRINLYEALNIAILESQSEFIAFAMTDDFRFASSIEKQADLLRNNLDLSIAYGDMFWSLKPNANPNAVSKIGTGSALPEPTLYSLLNFCLPHCAPLWRREIHAQVGYFDESFKSAGDWDFWIRCASAGLKFGYIKQSLGIYFLNPKGLSTSYRESLPQKEAERVRYKHFELFYEVDRSIGRCDSI
jgi:glycosyltransferase involved in cell wall biosynthesis